MARFKYLCEECQEHTWFNARERTRASGMQCSSCGSRHLVPSKASTSKVRLQEHKEAKGIREEITEKKTGRVPHR